MAGSGDDPAAVVGELLDWLGVDAELERSEQLPHNRRLTPGVWALRSAEGERMVLKHLRADRDPGQTAWDRHWVARDTERSRWNYWAREPLAYEHGLTDVYREAGISSPPCRGCRTGDREAALLLSWVEGEPGESWPLAAYGQAAEALGRAQAPFAHTWPESADPWLSRRFLREYSTEKPVSWELLDDDDVWQLPPVRELFPVGLREDVRFVHSHRDRLLAISESLPQTLCHLDVWPKNLFRRPDGRFVLIDWAFVGRGALGEDVGNLVPDACFDHFVAAEHLPELEQVVFDGYLRGLRLTGWNGNPDLVRLAMWSSSVKYDWLAPLTLASAGQERHHRYGTGAEIDGSYVLRERSRALQFNARRARQAIALADRRGL